MLQIKIVLLLLLLIVISVEAKGRRGSRVSSGRSSSSGGNYIWKSSPKSKPKGDWNYLNKAKLKGQDWNNLEKNKPKSQQNTYHHTKFSGSSGSVQDDNSKIGQLGKPVLAGAVGAVGGLYLGHQLQHWNRDNMDQYYSNPFMGHYGYYQDNLFTRCPPPRAVVVNDTLLITPELNKKYDRRCEYYDEEPPENYYYKEMEDEPVIIFAITLFFIVLLLVFSVPYIYRCLDKLEKGKWNQFR